MKLNIRSIQGWVGKYCISSDGRIYRETPSGLVLHKSFPTKYGYHITRLGTERKGRETIYVQGLVMEMFGTPKPTPGHVITHIDKNRSNNSINNLMWTSKVNTQTEKAIRIEVYDSATGETSTYRTMTECSAALHTNNVKINRMLNGEKFKNRTHLKLKRI